MPAALGPVAHGTAQAGVSRPSEDHWLSCGRGGGARRRAPAREMTYGTQEALVPVGRARGHLELEEARNLAERFAPQVLMWCRLVSLGARRE